MVDGPMTEETTKQVEWAAVWRTLPDEMRAGLAQLEAAHPGEVLSAVSGGVISAVPEGTELDTWMGELAHAGGFGAVDGAARTFQVPNFWIDPAKPAAVDPADAETTGEEFKIGFAAAANTPDFGDFEAQVTIYDSSQNIVETKFERFTTLEGELTFAKVPAGQYTGWGFVNNEGVDPGSEPNEFGYRSSFTFSFQVGDYAEGVEGNRQQSDYLRYLVGEMSNAETMQDFSSSVTAACDELIAIEELRMHNPALQDALNDAKTVVSEAAQAVETVLRHLVLDAADALGAVTGHVDEMWRTYGREATKIGPDPAVMGVLAAEVVRFAEQVKRVARPER